jgi:hypothetical protein
MPGAVSGRDRPDPELLSILAKREFLRIIIRYLTNRMAAQFVIDELNRVVFSYACGTLTYFDCTDHMDRLTSDRRFNPDFNQIIDFTDITHIELTVEQIHELSKRNIFGAKSRRAYLVASDLLYGLSRMFATLRETEGEPGIIAFRDLPSAIIWTNVPRQAAQKAFADLRQLCQPA